MPSRFAAVTDKEISQLIKRAVPEIHEEGDGWEFKQVKLCLFDLNLSIKLAKKFFVYARLELNLHLQLYLVDLFINKLKTKFNNLFYTMILNTKRKIIPQELNKCLQTFYLSARKSDDCGCLVIARQNCNRCRQQ